MNLYLLLASYGLCFGLMNEKAPFLNRLLYRVPAMRDEAHGTNLFTRMLDCAYCTGFHTGWVVWVVASRGRTDIFDLILFAFASSAFCYALDTLLRWFEQP